MRYFGFALPLIIAVAVASPARANLVVNGGFETGTFSSWTTALSDSNTAVNSILPYEGTYKAAFGSLSINGASSISQTLSTVQGQSYTLSFALDNSASANSQAGSLNFFTVQWDGSDLAPFPLTNVAAFGGYTVYSFTVSAQSGGNDTLTFSGYNDAGVFRLDAVQVDPVPEPASLLLLGASLAGLGIVRRSKSA